MAQQAVETYGWLSAGEMLDGLGLAETTPGPLILVTEFVGCFRHGGEPKLAFDLLGAAVTLWATFAPCFLWIFTGAPYVERLSSNPRLAGALAGVTAAVVGVIFNLSLWFALHVLFGTVSATRHGPLRLWTPDPASLNVEALMLAILAALLLFGLRFGIVSTLALTAAASLAWSFPRVLSSALSSDQLELRLRLARNPAVHERRAHPRTVPPAINPDEGRSDPCAATRVNLGERRAHIGAWCATQAATPISPCAVVDGLDIGSVRRLRDGPRSCQCRARQKRKCRGYRSCKTKSCKSHRHSPRTLKLRRARRWHEECGEARPHMQAQITASLCV